MAAAIGTITKFRLAGGTSITSSGITTTTGDAVFTAVMGEPGVTFNTPSDSKSNTPTVLTGGVLTASGVIRQGVWVKENAAGGSSHTATCTLSGSADITCFFGNVTGAASASLDSASAQTTDSSSPYSVTTGTLAQAANLAVLFTTSNSGGNPINYTDSTGFSTAASEPDGNTYWTGAVLTKTTAATTALTPSLTITGSPAAVLACLVFKEASGGGVTCTFSVTDATDTVSSTATAAISAALTRTDATDTLSSTATAAISAALTRTDATDTLASTATAAISAALTSTDATDTLASTATAAIAATLSATDATDTLSSSATVAVAVNLSATDATDTLASDAVVGAAPVTCDLSVTDATDTLASTATVAIAVNFAQTDEADTLDSAVVTAGDITVTFAQTDEADTLQSQATLESDRLGSGGRNAGRMDFRRYDDVDMRERVARLAVTDADDTLQATASAAYPERYVSAALFDGDDVVEASAVVVPWPALELMREHRLEKWHSKSRGVRRVAGP